MTLKQWQQELANNHRRRAKLRTCPQCHQPTWLGLDGDKCAFQARADLQHLTQAGTYYARTRNRTLFTFHGGMLTRRDRWSYHSTRWPALAAHECGNPIPGIWCHKHEDQPTQQTPTQPPF